MPTTEQLILDKLNDIKNMLEFQFPHTHDADSHYSYAITSVAGSATTTLNITFPQGFLALVRRMYVDVQENLTYGWYFKGRLVNQNEHIFVKPIMFRGGEVLTLKVTNASPIIRGPIGVLLDSFSRREGE